MELKGDNEMGYGQRRRLSIVLVIVAMCWITPLPGEGVVNMEEITAVSLLPGDGPGKYVYRRWGGSNLVPRCFAIDPNDGAFLVPEVDGRYNVRVHKFDSKGRFMKMLRLEGKADMVTEAAVAPNGDMYLQLSRPGGAHSLVCRYDRKGKLLLRFGSKGPITQEDLEAEKKAREAYARSPVRDKYFKSSVGPIFVMPNGEAFFVQGYAEHRVVFKFAGQSGQLLSKGGKLPSDLEAKWISQREQRERLHTALSEQKRIRTVGVAHSLIGPDGHFYYMSLSPERLEIRRVVFRD